VQGAPSALRLMPDDAVLNGAFARAARVEAYAEAIVHLKVANGARHRATARVELSRARTWPPTRENEELAGGPTQTHGLPGAGIGLEARRVRVRNSRIDACAKSAGGNTGARYEERHGDSRVRLVRRACSGTNATPSPPRTLISRSWTGSHICASKRGFGPHAEGPEGDACTRFEGQRRPRLSD